MGRRVIPGFSAMSRNYHFKRGMVTAVNSADDTATVTAGAVVYTDVPIVHHCGQGDQFRANGAVNGAAGAFRTGDSVLVSFENGEPRVIANLTEQRSCCDLGLSLAYKTYTNSYIGVTPDFELTGTANVRSELTPQATQQIAPNGPRVSFVSHGTNGTGLNVGNIYIDGVLFSSNITGVSETLAPTVLHYQQNGSTKYLFFYETAVYSPSFVQTSWLVVEGKEPEMVGRMGYPGEDYTAVGGLTFRSWDGGCGGLVTLLITRQNYSTWTTHADVRMLVNGSEKKTQYPLDTATNQFRIRDAGTDPNTGQPVSALYAHPAALSVQLW